MRLRNVAIACLCLSAAGCGEPTFDATDQASRQASLKRMGAKLDEPAKKQLARDMVTISIGPMFKAALSRKGSPEANGEEVLKSMHGMTASQIHAKAEEVRQKMGPRPGSK